MFIFGLILSFIAGLLFGNKLESYSIFTFGLILSFIVGLWFSNKFLSKHTSKKFKYGFVKKEQNPLDEQFLKASMNYVYQPKRILNGSESEIYWKLIEYLKSNYIVNPQVCLGEIVLPQMELEFSREFVN